MSNVSIPYEKLCAQRDCGVPMDGTDQTPTLNDFAARLSVATAPRGYLEPGEYKTTTGVTVTAPRATIEGEDPVSTTLHRTTPGDVLTIRNDGTVRNVSRNTGRVVGLRLMGDSATKRHDGYAALVFDGMHWPQVERVETLWTDIGADLRNNCYLARFRQYTTNLGTSHNVGVLLRGSTAKLGGSIAGSGSDIVFENCGLAGALAGAWCEPNGGGYHFHNGQLTGGSNNTKANDDGAGSLVLGKSYLPLARVAADTPAGSQALPLDDASFLFSNGTIFVAAGPTNPGLQIGYVSKTDTQTLNLTVRLPVDVPAGTEVRMIGDAPSIRLDGVSTEGTQRVWIVRSYSGMQALTLNDCSHLGHGMPDSPLGYIKCTNGIWNVNLRGNRIVGSWQAQTPAGMLSLAGAGNAQNSIFEQGTNGTANIGGKNVSLDTRPLVAQAGLKQAQALFGNQLYLGGGYLRFMGDTLQRWDTPTATWVNLG